MPDWNPSRLPSHLPSHVSRFQLDRTRVGDLRHLTVHAASEWLAYLTDPWLLVQTVGQSASIHHT